MHNGVYPGHKAGLHIVRDHKVRMGEHQADGPESTGGYGTKGEPAVLSISGFETDGSPMAQWRTYPLITPGSIAERTF